MANILFETYENDSMTNGKHMFKTTSDMAIAMMCKYPSSKYVLPHWKRVLHFCAQCPSIDFPSLQS